MIILLLMLILSLQPSTSGVASWYDETSSSHTYTASGEVFDQKKLTCASWDYPFGTRLKVTNLANMESVIVEVNDRGPARYLYGRVIDLSKEAFKKIAPLDKGLTEVKVEILSIGG